jgi:deoxyribodipyrimidine photo-lyase
MNGPFETDYASICRKLDEIDPIRYASTRNFVDGKVTYLSPYISRGVISTRQVLKHVLDKGYTLSDKECFVKELCWRDYFQRVAQHKEINLDIQQAQTSIDHYGIPTQIVEARTGIDGLDYAIRELYAKGYMHNHCRMYIASLACNMGRSHWKHPAQWMYYHLLDGDWASNACSWQWVAGANSKKKYYANQENINKYTHTHQANTYLDKSYEDIERMMPPSELTETQTLILNTALPASTPIQIQTELPTFVYNYYNLDPLWHKDEPGNRILLIEPNFFSQYPVSEACMNFMLALCKNIKDIQVYVGSFAAFAQSYPTTSLYYKEHPLNIGYFGNQEERDWISEEVSGYYPSFFSYWKKVAQQLQLP